MTTPKLSLRLLCLLLALSLTLLLAGCNTQQGGADVQSTDGENSSQAPEPVDHNIPEKSKEDGENDAPPAQLAQHGDFLWQVQSGDSTVYLMGTMHVLREDYALNQRVLDLFYASDALAVESNINDPELITDSAQYLMYEDGSNIFDHISEAGAVHLRTICEAYGYDAAMFEMVGFNAYTISSLFTVTAAQMAGFLTEGVDSQLLDLAAEADMPILELEYYADLYLRMNTLDDDTMERMCILILEEPEETIAQLDEMYGYYLSGDDQLMHDYLYTEVEYEGIEFQEKDALYNFYMLEERNEIMAESIAGYLSQPGTTFVAAGLAHFLGEGSIVELLEAQGYTVERI